MKITIASGKGGTGKKAVKILKTTGIEFFRGAGEMSVKEAYKQNRLQKQF